MHRLGLHVNRIRVARLARCTFQQDCVQLPVRRCFAIVGPFRKDEDGGKFVVRHWEEIAPGKYREVQEDEEERLKARIEELESQLKELSSGEITDLPVNGDNVAEEQDVEEDEENEGYEEGAEEDEKLEQELDELLAEFGDKSASDPQDLVRRDGEPMDIALTDNEPLEPETKVFLEKLRTDLAQHLPGLKLSISNERARELAKLGEQELAIELAKDALIDTDILEKSVPQNVLEGVLPHNEDPDVPKYLSVQFPKHQRAYLQGFNKTLQEVTADRKNVENSAILWSKYIRCKEFLPEFLEQVSTPVWEVLWDSQYLGNPIIAKRTEHLWVLIDDMVRVGHDLTPDQKLIRIESMFTKGSQQEAISLWKSEWVNLDGEHLKRPDFRDLGIRLHADIGDLKAAHNLAFNTESRPRGDEIASLIATWAQKGAESDLKVAWSLYAELRRRLGSQMAIEDYDQIVMAFINTGRAQLALGVFRDLVLSGSNPSLDRETRDWKSLEILERLQSGTVGADDLAQTSLAALASIPKKMENKFFYASWLKRLIGLGEVDATIPVLALMYERGVRPDAKHLNGIIGAWFRGQDKERHSLSLQIAWSMVKERLKFVARRKGSLLGEQSSLDAPDLGILVPPHISRNLPPASIETFCLLLQYYERRGMQKSADLVQEFLRDAEIRPNSYFMNHLMYGELRKGDVRKSWEIYQSMRETVKPDLESFAALWDCEKLYASGRAIPSKESFPAARRMFYAMMDWLSGLDDRQKEIAQREFTQGFYNQIIRCFCFQRDNSGILLALYALRDKFGFYPDVDTVRMITIQLARSGEKAPTAKRRRKRFSSNNNSTKNMTKISDIFDAVAQDRTEALHSMGIDEELMEDMEKGEELLYKLSEVLRIFLRHISGLGVEDISPLEEDMDQVAWDMGIGGIDMGAPQYTVSEEA